MKLVRLNPGTKFKANCNLCKATGVIVTPETKDGLAYVCFSCNGRGYKERIVKEEDSIFVESGVGTIIEEVDDFVREPISFTGRREALGVTHVVYPGNFLEENPESLKRQGYDPRYVLPYGIFFRENALPLPLDDQICPAMWEERYGKKEFDNKCDLGDYKKCPKFNNSGECWKKFYGKGSLILSHGKKQRKLKEMSSN